VVDQADSGGLEMVGLVRKLAVAGFVAALLTVLQPSAGSATVNGPCQVTGDASISGSTNLNSTTVWHLKRDDVVTGHATYSAQSQVNIYVLIFGVPREIWQSNGKDTKGSAGPFKVSDWSQYTRVFAAGGKSDLCDGQVLIVVDDQSPFLNAVGLAGLVLGAIGLLGLIILLAATGGGGCGGAILGGFLGLVLGVGLALVAAEAGAIDPSNYAGLILAGVAGIVGAVAPTVKGRF
jgi:hypothetical protein